MQRGRVRTDHLFLHFSVIRAGGVLGALRQGHQPGGLHARQRRVAARPRRQPCALTLDRRGRRLHKILPHIALQHSLTYEPLKVWGGTEARGTLQSGQAQDVVPCTEL